MAQQLSLLRTAVDRLRASGPPKPLRSQPLHGTRPSHASKATYRELVTVPALKAGGNSDTTSM